MALLACCHCHCRLACKIWSPSAHSFHSHSVLYFTVGSAVLLPAARCFVLCAISYAVLCCARCFAALAESEPSFGSLLARCLHADGAGPTACAALCTKAYIPLSLCLASCILDKRLCCRLIHNVWRGAAGLDAFVAPAGGPWHVLATGCASTASWLSRLGPSHDDVSTRAAPA